jgi:hypothetical protein
MILQCVKFLIIIFLRGHSPISELKDPTVGFKRKVQKNNMNGLLQEGVV